MRIHRQLLCAFSTFGLLFGISALVISYQVTSLSGMNELVERDQTVAHSAMRLDRAARKVEVSLLLSGGDPRLAATREQLLREGRQELSDAVAGLTPLIGDPHLEVELADIDALAKAMATAEVSSPPVEGVLGESPDALIEARVQALALKLGVLIDQAHEQLELTRQAAMRVAARVRWVVCVTVIVASILGILLTVALARRMSSRLRALAGVAGRLGSGEAGARAECAGGDEITALGRVINQMADDLQRAQRRVVEAERLAAIGQVIVTIRHELGNPLQGIFGSVDVIESGALSPVQAEGVRHVRREAQRLAETLARLDNIQTTATREYAGTIRMLDLEAGGEATDG